MARPKGSKNLPKEQEFLPADTYPASMIEDDDVDDVSHETIISPIIHVDGDTHPLFDLEAQNEMPILKSVGFAKVSPTSREYISYVMTTRGRKVLNIEVSEPNLKDISIDEAKTAFVTTFLNEDISVGG